MSHLLCWCYYSMVQIFKTNLKLCYANPSNMEWVFVAPGPTLPGGWSSLCHEVCWARQQVIQDHRCDIYNWLSSFRQSAITPTVAVINTKYPQARTILFVLVFLLNLCEFLYWIWSFVWIFLQWSAQLLIDGFKVDRLVIILLQRGRLSPSIPLLHKAPGNHVIRPSFSPDASSVKEETGKTVILTSN